MLLFLVSKLDRRNQNAARVLISQAPDAGLVSDFFLKRASLRQQHLNFALASIITRARMKVVSYITSITSIPVTRFRFIFFFFLPKKERVSEELQVGHSSQPT